jgi:O-antigen/teichoic acid export membrane protein
MTFSLREAANIIQLLLIRGTGMLSLFLVNVLIARNFGPATQGLFQIGLGWVIVISTIGRFGQDQLMLRTAAECKAEGNVDKVQRHLVASLVLSTGALVGATILAIGLLQSGLVQQVKSQSSAFISVMALAILPTGILMIITETLRGWQKINLAITWQGSIPQTILLVVLAFLVFLNQGLNQISVAATYPIVFALAACFAMQSWLSISELKLSRPFRLELRTVFLGGVHFWVYAILTALTAWIDMLILGLLDTPETVGRYAAIVRTGAVLGTAVQIISTGAVARLALLYADEKYIEFVKLFRTYFLFFAMGALLLAPVLILYPMKIMSMWGATSSSDYRLFMVYGAFQIVNFAFCLFGFVAIVMGLELEMATIQFGLFVFKIVSISLGDIFYGIEGAILASGLSLLFTNVLFVWAFLRLLAEKKISLIPLL